MTNQEMTKQQDIVEGIAIVLDAILAICDNIENNASNCDEGRRFLNMSSIQFRHIRTQCEVFYSDVNDARSLITSGNAGNKIGPNVTESLSQFYHSMVLPFVSLAIRVIPDTVEIQEHIEFIYEQLKELQNCI